MNRVLLAGYYGMANTGDDALLAVSNWGARTYLEAGETYATATSIPRIPGARHLLPMFTPAPRFRGENRLRRYFFSARSTNIVFGGGSVFHSTADLKVKIGMLRLSGRGRHVAVGVSLGPFRDCSAEKTCGELLKRLSFIGLRDKESLTIARSICPDVRSERTFDLAPMLPRASGLTIDKLQPAGARRGIGIALCNYDRFVGGDSARDLSRMHRIVGMLGQLASDAMNDEELVFIDFNGHPHFGDHQLHDEIARSVAAKFRIRHVTYAADPVGVLKLISGLRAIVAMRLHAAVFGYLTETPTIMLSYHPKCLGWASEIGLADDFVFDSHDFDPNQLCAKIVDAMWRTTGNAALPPAEAERHALNNWAWLHE